MKKESVVHYPVKQLSEDWHKFRTGKITASLAAACVGLNPFCSPQKAYRQILGLETHVSNWYMEHGREFEPVAVQAYELETGNICAKSGFWQHLNYPWLGASPDRVVLGGGLLEVKCSKADKPSLPIYWRIQAVVQLVCTGQDWCDVCWYRDGQIKVWRVDRSGSEELLNRLQWFYDSFVKSEQPPARGGVKPWAFPEQWVEM